MRLSDLAARGLALCALLLAACETTLPGGDLGAAASTSEAGAPPPPTVSGCLPFRNVPGVDAVTGAMRSLPAPDGGALIVVDDAVGADADVPSLALVAPAGATVADCLSTAMLPASAPTSAFDPSTLSPLSGFVAGSVAAFYYVDPTYGAVGVATQDPSDGRFRPGSAASFDRG